MEHADTVIQARWVIPVEPAGTVLEHHGVVVKDGRILALLPADEAARRYRAAETVRLGGHVVIPGLINTHTHAAMTLFRGLADDLPLMTWLNDHVWPAEAAWVSPDFVRDGTRHAVAEMLRGGTTCFSDMYFFPNETARIARQCGMRAVVGLIAFDFPTVWAKGPAEYLDKGLQVHDEYRGDPLIATAFAPHAPYTVSDAPLERIQVLADELDIPIHMHVHETAEEVRQGESRHGERPLARLRRLGLLSPRLLAVHMTQLTPEEIGEVAAAGVHVLHCPESNLKLASGFCPAHALDRAGVNVALGTDGAASNNDLDMIGEMRTAALLGKAVAGDASALPADHALRMATINAARALGLDEHIGSLVPGKAADLTAVHLDDIDTLPLFHPLSQLIYAGTRDKVTDVWVAGRRLLKDRTLTSVDVDEVRRKAGYWQEDRTLTMGHTAENIDPGELRKFDAHASRWWDPHGAFKPLHDINPLRLDYIAARADLEGKAVADVGCGGGLLSEGMAARGARVTGVDMSESAVTVARIHLLESRLDVEYLRLTAEALAEQRRGTFDVVTCMELLEHVPDPGSVVHACATLVRPGGSVFLSTLNRTPKAYLFAVLGAEYLLQLLPKRTHDYAKFIRPSELQSWCTGHGLGLRDLTGLGYNPLTRTYGLTRDVGVNYMMHAVKED